MVNSGRRDYDFSGFNGQATNPALESGSEVGRCEDSAGGHQTGLLRENVSCLLPVVLGRHWRGEPRQVSLGNCGCAPLEKARGWGGRMGKLSRFALLPLLQPRSASLPGTTNSGARRRQQRRTKMEKSGQRILAPRYF